MRGSCFGRKLVEGGDIVCLVSGLGTPPAWDSAGVVVAAKGKIDTLVITGHTLVVDGRLTITI